MRILDAVLLISAAVLVANLLVGLPVVLVGAAALVCIANLAYHLTGSDHARR